MNNSTFDMTEHEFMFMFNSDSQSCLLRVYRVHHKVDS